MLYAVIVLKAGPVLPLSTSEDIFLLTIHTCTVIKDFTSCMRVGAAKSNRQHYSVTLIYRHASSKITYEYNLSKLHGSLLRMLLTYYCKQVHMLLNFH
jgi:hypothetical protein